MEASSTGVQPVDLAIGAVLVIFALRGYLRGLYSEITAVIALVGSLAGAFRWTPLVVPRWANAIPGPSASDTAISFLFVFGALGLALRFIFSLLRRAWSLESSSPFDRLGGAVFGLCKGGVVMGCMVLMLRTFTPVPASDSAKSPGAGLFGDLNNQLARSPAASELARMTSELFSKFADAAEIRLRMLAASDNEGS